MRNYFLFFCQNNTRNIVRPMSGDIVKSQYRFPEKTHEALIELSSILRGSQNEVVVECVQAIMEMVHSDSIHVPDIVARARAVLENRRHPQQISSADARRKKGVRSHLAKRTKTL